MKVDIFNTNKKYNVIYADPPWEYKESGGGHRGTAGLPYETMSTQDICDLPIDKISEDNSFLYLWATDPKLPQALEVMKAWGYTFKGVAYVWVKQNKKTDSVFWGMGRYSRKNVELVLLGVKGNAIKDFPPIKRNSHQVVFSKVEEHSKKPDKIRQEIVEVLGSLPRIELFARQHADGWDCWGNEAPEEHTVEIEQISLFMR